MTPPRNRIKPRKPESQIARKPAWSPGFLQKRLLQTRGCAAVINRFVILHGRLYISVQAERAPCTLKCSVGVAARIDAAPVEHAGISL
jgi:hypothetical protein